MSRPTINIDGRVLATMRDKYLRTDEAIRACDPRTISAPAESYRFIRNRIESAFLAGAHAAEAKIGECITFTSDDESVPDAPA